MQLFDLHCDTLYRSVEENKDLFNNDFHISIKKGKENIPNWTQCFAIFIPDEIKGQNALNLLKKAYKKFCAYKKYENKDFKMLFTVEGGAALAGDLKNLDLLKEYDVKAMTLTWNGKCEIGDGILVKNPTHITEFGKKCVQRMNELNISIDVSHASIPLFYDVIELSSKPIIATHSNSKRVCNHVRNLSDDQFLKIKDSRGIVGLNFCVDFLNNKDEADMFDILKHAEHFLSIGGEDTLSIGSDFDGTDIPKDMKGIESMLKLYEIFLKNYKEELVNKIFFKNANKFFNK